VYRVGLVAREDRSVRHLVQWSGRDEMTSVAFSREFELINLPSAFVLSK
jgi:hypothetical protein